MKGPYRLEEERGAPASAGLGDLERRVEVAPVDEGEGRWLEAVAPRP